MTTAGETPINLKDHFGICGGNDPGDRAKIQTAFDTAPIGCTLVLPTDYYLIDQPLTMTRYMHLDMQSSPINSTSLNPAHDGLRVEIEDTGYLGDVRNLRISGGQINVPNGRAAIAVNTQPDPRGTNNLMIKHGIHYGNQCAIILGGHDTQFSIIEENTLQGGIHLDGCSDGNRIVKNTIFGYGPGILVNLVAGAYKTFVGHNSITSGGGALDVWNGSQIDFENNTIEQPAGWGENANHASIRLRGTNRYISGVRIVANNFGSSLQADNPHIWVENGEENIIDDNDFHTRMPVDIRLDSGSRYNRIGPRNRVKGVRAGDPTTMLQITDAGCGNAGVQKSSASLGLMNGWSASTDFMFFKDLSGVVHFRGRLIGGTATSGTQIGTLPVGFRPNTHLPVLMYENAGGTVAMLVLQTDGKIVCGSVPASTSLTLDAVSYYSRWKDSYDTGPL